MEVKLLHYSPIELVIKAIRRCADSEDQSDSWQYGSDFLLGEKDQILIKKVIQEGHTSTLEHINFTFDIQGISRAVLQELSRHRIASPSVQSTRWALGKMVKKGHITEGTYHLTGNKKIDELNKRTLNDLIQIIKEDGIPNDIAKYGITEALLTSEIFTINARSLRNLLTLRTSKRALAEIREMAFSMHNSIPFIYKILFEDIMEVK